MKLRRPTDFLILEALDEHGRNVATNLAHLTDKSRKNINTRLPVLEDYGLVRKIGPAERSGLYEITRTGRTALMYRDQYDEVEDFARLIENADSPSPTNVEESGYALARDEAVRNEEPDRDDSDE